MPEAKAKKRLLFVDDEASIRLTLPPILEKAGFDVHIAESVSDALFEINSYQFDGLVTDLNIGEEGDGFLVASGMRHIQPNCAVFILTGYPAFETALQAIHSQVDDYLVKPVEVDSLISTLKEKLEREGAKPASKRISTLLRENLAEISASLDEAFQRDGNRAEGSVEEMKRHFRNFLNGIIDAMESEAGALKADVLRAASDFGRSAARSGGSAAAIVKEFRILEETIYAAIQRNLSVADLVPLVSDLKRMTLAINSLLEQSAQGFAGAGKKVAQV